MRWVSKPVLPDPAGAATAKEWRGPVGERGRQRVGAWCLVFVAKGILIEFIGGNVGAITALRNLWPPI